MVTNGVEGKPEEPQRISRTEFYPKVGDPAEGLKAVTPPFSKDLLDASARLVMDSQLSITLTYRHTGDNPQELIVALQNPQQAGGQISIEISGDWTAKPEVLQGVPLIANYDGSFYRRINPQADGPIAKDGDILEPTKPMVIGIASARKGQYWPYELDPVVFPNGARISKFLAPDIKEGLDVVAGETIICYVILL